MTPSARTRGSGGWCAQRGNPMLRRAPPPDELGSSSSGPHQRPAVWLYGAQALPRCAVHVRSSTARWCRGRPCRSGGRCGSCTRSVRLRVGRHRVVAAAAVSRVLARQ